MFEFGEPRRGVHSFRIFDISVFDTVTTLLLALFVKQFIKISWPLILFYLFLASILIHRHFNVKTKITEMIF